MPNKTLLPNGIKEIPFKWEWDRIFCVPDFEYNHYPMVLICLRFLVFVVHFMMFHGLLVDVASFARSLESYVRNMSPWGHPDNFSCILPIKWLIACLKKGVNSILLFLLSLTVSMPNSSREGRLARLPSILDIFIWIGEVNYMWFCFVGNMIKLFKVKEKQRAENPNGTAPVKKQSAGELRLHRGTIMSCMKEFHSIWKLLGTIIVF